MTAFRYASVNRDARHVIASRDKASSTSNKFKKKNGQGLKEGSESIGLV